MKTFRLIISWLLITFLLLGSVVMVDTINNFIMPSYTPTVLEQYPVKDMLCGIVSESFRALLICYLFLQIKNAGSSYMHSIKFGLIISGLIGTMWLVIGYGSFQLKDPERFVVYDGIILFIQGVFSGAGLQFLYTKGWLLSPGTSAQLNEGS